MFLISSIPIVSTANMFGIISMRFQIGTASNEHKCDQNNNTNGCRFNQIIKSINFHTSIGRHYKLAFQSICAALVIGTPTLAQSIEAFGIEGNYQIMRVAESKVCFAVYSGKSADQSDVTYATYKTKDGDRWQVVGYVDDNKVTAKSDLLTIQFDGENALSRAVDFSRGDFVLPFTENQDLEQFDAGVNSASELSFKLKNANDSITLDLEGLRKAKTSIETCLEGIE